MLGGGSRGAWARGEAEKPRGISMALQPVLLVGVGGSGAKALRTLRQTLMRRLRQHGWKGSDLPAAWQIVAFDTVTDQTRDGYAAPLLPASCYTGLVDPSTE